MINLKKIIFAASIAVASLGFSLSSQAVLVSHDLLSDGVIVGEVTVSLLENGAQSNGVEFIDEFVSLTLNEISVPTVLQFAADVDGDDIFAGIQLLFISAQSISEDIYAEAQYIAGSSTNAYFSESFSTFDPISFGELTLSTARVVSEPSVLALFALALVGFGMRRRAL